MLQYSGAEIFKLVDTHGLPLDIINMSLREKNAFFNCEEFIAAAKTAGWTPKRIVNTLISASPLQGDKLAELKSKLEQTVNSTHLLTDHLSEQK